MKWKHPGYRILRTSEAHACPRIKVVFDDLQIGETCVVPDDIDYPLEVRTLKKISHDKAAVVGTDAIVEIKEPGTMMFWRR